MGQRTAKQVAAKKVVDKKAIEKAAAAVKEAREKAVDLPVTPLDEWKTDVAAETKLLLPSGHVCIVRPVGLQTFVAKGVIPNALLPIVQRAVGEGRGVEDKELAALSSDPDAIKDMIDMADHVVCACVVAPKITPNSVRDEIMADESLSEDEKHEKRRALLFADEVDVTDKMFVFQYAVGGSRELETFREQQNAHVAKLATQPHVRKASK